MTVRRLLSEADSMELTKWAVFFEVKRERNKDARDSADFERRITGR